MPFSLGHEILLQRFKNGFSIENPGKPTHADLILGVFICSRKYTRTPSLDGFRIPFRARILKWCFGKRYLDGSFARFAAYVADGSFIQEFDPLGEERESGPTGTPTVQAVKISLMSNLGMTEDQALNMPFSLAFFDHLSWLEGQGIIQIIDEKERERQTAIEKLAKASEAAVMAWRDRISGKAPCSV